MCYWKTLRKKCYGVDTKLKFFVFSLTRSISGVSFTVHTLPFMFLRSIWYRFYREKNKSAVKKFHNDKEEDTLHFFTKHQTLNLNLDSIKLGKNILYINSTGV